MRFLEDFCIDGKPILVPDTDMTVSFSDLDAEDSGRDESGVMHRIPVRFGVRTWELHYSHLTLAEYAYLEGLFRGKTQFTLTFRDLSGQPDSCTAYRSAHQIAVRRQGALYRDCSFRIIEC